MCRLFVGASADLWESQTRSVRMDGMVTSVRLEKMFWTVLEEIAEKDDFNIPQLLHQLYNESIDAGHDLGNFTSFLRVCCLRYLDLQLCGLVKKSEKRARTIEDILAIEAQAHRDREARRTNPTVGTASRRTQKYVL